jgi:hypothetical protein
MFGKSISFLSAAVVCVWILGVTGCGESGPKLHKIKGTATHNGKPLAKLYVSFVPDDQMTKATATAVTDEKGKFELKLGSTPGCYPGQHTIVVADPLAAVGGKSSDDPDYIAVTKKYGYKSELKINIEKDEPDFKLEL